MKISDEVMNEMYKSMGISEAVRAYGQKTLEKLEERFREIDRVTEFNQLKVLRAMQAAKVDAECFNASSGYGYDDIGRDTIERIYADIFRFGF